MFIMIILEKPFDADLSTVIPHQAHAEQCYAEGIPGDPVPREQGDWIGWFQQGETGANSLSSARVSDFSLQCYQVFCSQWLSHKQVIFGTKCNKLMVVDVNTRHMDQIPSLQSSENSVPPDQECGIHSIEINPSRTLLATGARNSNDVAVYRQGRAERIILNGPSPRYSNCQGG